MINLLIVGLLILLISSFIFTAFSTWDRKNGVLMELKTSVQSLVAWIVILAQNIINFIRSLSMSIILYGLITLILTIAIIFGSFLLSFTISRNTQEIGIGLNNTLNGPIHNGLEIASNFTSLVAEVWEPTILVYDAYIGFIRILAQPAIDIALDCPNFIWIDLVWNTLDILQSGLFAIFEYLENILNPISPTAGEIDVFTPLFIFGQSIAKIKEVLLCECRALGFYWEYLTNLVASPNLWLVLDRIVNFVAVIFYEFIRIMWQIGGLFVDIITGDVDAIVQFFFNNPYSSPNTFRFGIIIRQLSVAAGGFLDDYVREVGKIWLGFLPGNIANDLIPSIFGPILGNILSVPVMIAQEIHTIFMHIFTFIAGNYGPKFHEDYDIILLGLYEAANATANNIEVSIFPITTNLSCAIRAILYNLIGTFDVLGHIGINLYSVSVKRKYYFFFLFFSFFIY